MINGILKKSSFCHKIRQKEEKMLNKKLIERGKFVNRGVLVVGIDIGKGKHVAVGTSIEYSFTKPFYIRDQRKSFELFEEKIEEIEFRIKKILEDTHEARYLMTIPGIAYITAATVIAESGGLRRYEKMESVLKIAGLNLYEISSGKHEGEKHITKRGRSLMRQKLYFAALQQAREGMPLYSFYRKLTEDNGVKRTKALIAVARKLLKIMFALVRDKREFVLDCEDEEVKKAA
jgi:hypothetical protein